MNETKLLWMQACQQLLYRGPLVVLERIERLGRRFRVTGNVADRPRSDRPCVTTAAYDPCVSLQLIRNRRLTAAATGRQYGIYPQTIGNRLRQNVQPIRAYRPYFGQILTRLHRTTRRDRCRRHLHFRRADCDLILFSVECPFKLSHADGGESVYRRRGDLALHSLQNMPYGLANQKLCYILLNIEKSFSRICFVSSARHCIFECNTTSDWLNHMVLPISSCLTFKYC